MLSANTAILDSNLPRLRSLLQTEGLTSDPQVDNCSNQSLVLLAILAGNPDVVKLLLEHGAQLNILDVVKINVTDMRWADDKNNQHVDNEDPRMTSIHNDLVHSMIAAKQFLSLKLIFQKIHFTNVEKQSFYCALFTTYCWHCLSVVCESGIDWNCVSPDMVNLGFAVIHRACWPKSIGSSNIRHYRFVVVELLKLQSLTELLYALAHERYTHMIELIQHGADVEYLVPMGYSFLKQGSTYLHCIVTINREKNYTGNRIKPEVYDVIRTLIEYGCDINARNIEGQTVFHATFADMLKCIIEIVIKLRNRKAMQCQTGIINFGLSPKVDITLVNRKGMSVLGHILNKCDNKTIREVIAMSTMSDVQSIPERSSLYRFILEQDDTYMHDMLDRGFNIHSPGLLNTALDHHDDRRKLKRILELGADPNAMSPKVLPPIVYMFTPYRSFGLEAELLFVLLRYGADVNSEESPLKFILQQYDQNYIQSWAKMLMLEGATIPQQELHCLKR